MASLLGIGVTGLKGQQAALETVGNNITNANTDGYRRRRVEFVENGAQFLGGNWMGSGVQVQAISRNFDRFVYEQVINDTSIHRAFKALSENSGQLDSLLASTSTGLQPAIERMFQALQTTVDNPSSIPARKVLLSETKGMVDRFHSMHDRLSEQKRVTEGQMAESANQITLIAAGIAELNEQIQIGRSSANGQAPLDLLDRRESMVQKLSKLTDVRTTQTADGSTNIYIGNHPLVLGNKSNSVLVKAGVDNPNNKMVFFKQDGNVHQLSELKGGILGGLIEFREKVLEPVTVGIGRLALVINDTFNQQQKRGIDLDGLKGENIFTDINQAERTYARVSVSNNNSDHQGQKISVHIKNSGQLKPSNYTVKFSGPSDTTYEVIRQSDGQMVAKHQITDKKPDILEVDGFEIHIEHGEFSVGDKFYINTSRNELSHLNVTLSSPTQFALASPIVTNSETGNTGNASISPGIVYDTNTDAFSEEGKLKPPILVRFTSANRYDVLDNTDPMNPIPLFPPLMNQKYTPGLSNQILPKNTQQTAFTSFGGVLASAVTYQAPAPAAVVSSNNGFYPERINVVFTNPDTKQTHQQPELETPKHASAREIARLLTERDGITASARTTVQLANFKASSNPFLNTTLQLNGIKLTDPIVGQQNKYDGSAPKQVPSPMTPNFLADRINANYELKEKGIVARSNGTELTIIALNGDDINLEVSGDADAGFDVSNGHDIALKSVGKIPFKPLNNNDGYDFSKEGPYQYEFDVPGQGTFNITLNGNHSDAQGVKEEIKTKLEKAGFVWSGELDVRINQRGQIHFQPRLSMTGEGTQGSNKLTMGGQIKVVTDANYHIEIAPPSHNLFPEKPKGKPVHLGYEATISGAAKKGDRFTIGFNKNATTDSRNGRQMINLGTKKLVEGRTSYVEEYTKLVQQVGSVTSRSKQNEQSSAALLKSTENTLLSKSGVNLNEEAASLIRHEQAYNATAKIIQVAKQLFDTLITSV